MAEEIIYSKDAEGAVVEISLGKFLHDFEKEHEVPPVVAESEDHADLTSEQVVEAMYQLANGNMDLPEEVAAYSKYFTKMKEALAASKELKADLAKAKEQAKADAIAKKEEEKKAKAEAEANLLKRRNVFLDGAAVGFKASEDKFREDLVGMRDALPNGVHIQMGADDSFGMAFDDDTSDEALSESLGFLFNAQGQNQFMANAYQFLIGDIANELLKRGIYTSMIQCGKALEERVLKDFGKKLSGRNIESYARMSKRIPTTLRNAEVDPTAYLAVSDMKLPEKPSKSKIEDKDELKKALTDWEADVKAVEAERLKLAEILKAGKMVVDDGEGNKGEVTMTSRKDILPLVDKVKYAHGLAVAPDPDKKTATDYMRQYCEAEIMTRHFVGVHKKGVVVVHPEAGSAGTVELTLAQLNQAQEEAINNLTSMFYGDKLAELVKGERTIQVPVMEDKTVGDKTTKVIKKDAQGNPVKEDKIEKVYPRMLSAS